MLLRTQGYSLLSSYLREEEWVSEEGPKAVPSSGCLPYPAPGARCRNKHLLRALSHNSLWALGL